MASITTEIRGERTLYRVEWRDKDGRRRKIRLGAVTKDDAESVKSRIQSIVTAQAVGNDIPLQTALWLADLGDSLYEKLVRQRLVKPRPKMVLKNWLDQYVTRYRESNSNLRKMFL